MSVGIFLPTLVFSNTILNRLQGSVGLEYQLEKQESDSSKSKKTSIGKFVELGYNDFIYNKNLLEYAVQVKFNDVETETNNDNSTSSTNNQLADYSLDLNFFSKSRIPMSISASKSTKPSTSINDDNILETTSSQQKFDLKGNVLLNSMVSLNYLFSNIVSETNSTDLSNDVIDNLYKLNINYYDYSIKTSYDNTKRNSSNSTSSKDDNFSIGIDKRNKNYNIRTNYEHSESTNNELSNTIDEVEDEYSLSFSTKKYLFDIIYTENNISNSVDKSTNEENEDIDTEIDIEISDTLDLNNTLYTTKESIGNDKTFANNLSINWNPNNKFRLNSNISINTSDIQDTKTTTNTNNFFSSYKFTDYFDTNQQLSNTNTKNSNGYKSEDIVLSGTVRYMTPIGLKSSLDLIGNVSGSQTTSSEEEETGNTYSYDLTAGVVNNFDNMNSILFYDLNYYQSFSTLASEEQKIRLDSEYNAKFLYNLGYNATFDYTFRKSTGNDGTRTEKIMNIFNGLTADHRFDVRGLINANVGLKYSHKQVSDQEKTTFLDPYGTVKFMYRLWRTLTYNATAEIKQDSLTDITHYRIENKLRYKFRKLTIELDIDYNEQTGSDIENDSRSNVMLIMKRNL